jgi:hypothetical protein
MPTPPDVPSPKAALWPVVKPSQYEFVTAAAPAAFDPTSPPA